MDAKATAVLEMYHTRIDSEERERGNIGHAPPTDAWLDSQLLAVGRETGQLINIIARSFNAPNILEIGTSYGYSGIWLADAARATGGRVTTLELKDFKSAHAKEMARKAGLVDYIDFRIGDAVHLIKELSVGIDFVLLDLWKDLYVPCLEAFYPKLNPGAVIIADNILRPGGEPARKYVNAIRELPGIESVMLPVGMGIEVSRYSP